MLNQFICDNLVYFLCFLLENYYQSSFLTNKNSTEVSIKSNLLQAVLISITLEHSCLPSI